MNNAINLLELSIIRKICNKKRYQTLSVKQYKLSSLYNNKGNETFASLPLAYFYITLALFLPNNSIFIFIIIICTYKRCWEALAIQCPAESCFIIL